MTPDAIPQELLNITMSHVANQGYNLAPLLLVSKSFYYPARALVFRHVSIAYCRNHLRSSRISLLLDILKSSPEILQYVRDIVVNFPEYREDLKTNINQPLSPAAVIFIDVLQRLTTSPRIISLTLNGPGTSPFSLSKLRAEIFLRLSLVRFKPSLRSLSFNNLESVPRFFVVEPAEGSYIEELRMCGCSTYCASASTYTSPPYSPLSKVVNLVHDQPRFIEPIQCVTMHNASRRFMHLPPCTDQQLQTVETDLSSLKTFTTAIRSYDVGRDYGALSRILQRSPSLQSLTLETYFPRLPNLSEFSTPSTGPSSGSELDFRRLPKLTHLTLIDALGCSHMPPGLNHDKIIRAAAKFLDRSFWPTFEDFRMVEWCPLALEHLSLKIGIEMVEFGSWPWDMLDLGERGLSARGEGDEQMGCRGWILVPGDSTFGPSSDSIRSRDPPRYKGRVPSIHTGMLSLGGFLDDPAWGPFYSTVHNLSTLKVVDVTLRFYTNVHSKSFSRILLDKEDILRHWPQDTMLARSIQRTVESLSDNGRVEVRITLDTLWQSLPS